MTLILIVLTILSVICTWLLIDFGIKTAKRIAVATERSAFMLEAIFDSLPEEATARVKAIRAAREQEQQEANKVYRRGSVSEDRWNKLRAKKRIPSGATHQTQD